MKQWRARKQCETLLSSSASTITPVQPSVDVILAPLLTHSSYGYPKPRRNYNYYSEYPNDFFLRLFRDYIHTGLVYQKDAAEFLNICPSTLSSKYNVWLNNDKGLAGTSDRRGRKRKISDDDEKMIKQQIIKRMQNNDITQNGHLVDFIMNLVPNFYPSIGYLSRFKKRYGLGSRRTKIDKNSNNNSDDMTIDDELELLVKYYQDVTDAIAYYGPSCVFNYDEKPLSTAPKEVSSFQHKKRKTVPLVSNSGDPDRVYTAACAVAANGDKLPLTIIKKGVRVGSASSQLVQQAIIPHNNHMQLTKKGWVNADSMLHWLKHVFATNVSLPCALIMDGYQAHWTDEVKAAANELDIELISMPPNHTDEIQPLDVGVFGALQTMTDRSWTKDDSVTEYLDAFQRAWRAFKPECIRKAFYTALSLRDGVLEDHIADQRARQNLVDAQNAIDAIENILLGVLHFVPQ